MNWINIESSNIKAVAFDLEAGTLGVRFLEGSEYHYFDVPEWIFNDLIELPISKGEYFNSMIKTGGYKFEKQG